MNAPIFVEQLARNGDLIARHRVARLPARIGRGYDCDVILDDPYVAPSHAVLEAVPSASVAEGDGTPMTATLQVRDLSSKNGLYLESRRSRSRQRQASIELKPDTVFRIGHSLLRVRAADQAVAAELQDTTLHAWEGAPPIALAVLGLLLVGLFEKWEGSTEGGEPLQYVLVLAGLLGSTLLWAMGWGLVNRIFGGRVRFGRHFFIAACAIFATSALGHLAAIAAFAFSLEFLTRFSELVFIAILGVTVYFHLLTVRPRARRAAAVAAITLVLAGGAFQLITQQINTHRLSEELYMSSLKPPALRVSGNETAAKFFEQAQTMKPALDKEAKEPPAESGED